MSTENNLQSLYNNSIKILTDLIAFKTISGENNSPLIDYCENILKSLGAESFRTFDDEKKRKLIHLICRVKGEKVYDEKKEVGDMKIKLDDADLVINEVLGKMRVEGINVL